jgi:hypothetical protein
MPASPECLVRAYTYPEQEGDMRYIMALQKGLIWTLTVNAKIPAHVGIGVSVPIEEAVSESAWLMLPTSELDTWTQLHYDDMHHVYGHASPRTDYRELRELIQKLHTSLDLPTSLCPKLLREMTENAYAYILRTRWGG